MASVADTEAPEWAEGVPKVLFPTVVVTPKLELFERFQTVIQRTRDSLQSRECIQEVKTGNEAVARFASSVSQLCDHMDQLWAQYDYEHRALTLYSSDGLAQNRFTAETRVPGSVAFAHLTPSNNTRINAPENPPAQMPVPVRCELAREDMAAPGVPLVLTPSAVPVGGDPPGSQRPSANVDAYISVGVALATRVLADFERSAHMPSAEGDRALGPLVLNQLLRAAHDLIRLLGLLESVWTQHRIQLLHVADVTRVTALANRTAENGFVALP